MAGAEVQQRAATAPKPVLFIGTSFLGAVKQGWQQLQREPAIFLGVDAPMFVKHLNGVALEGRRLRFPPALEVFSSRPRSAVPAAANAANAANETFPDSTKSRGAQVNLGTVRAVVFVDMFFRHVLSLAVDASGMPLLQGVPVSDGALRAVRSNFFNGAAGLRNHKRYGTVPVTSCLPLISSVRAAVKVPVVVLGCPRPPRSNVGEDRAAAKARFDFIDAFYERELEELGIRYVRQPVELLDEDRCATPDRFSRGAHKFQDGALDPHMNAEFGEALCRLVLDL